ncbi:MAG: hypothetical protein GY870_14440, partial [archaeon]|nr:hypothetical protein [archaeon]
MGKGIFTESPELDEKLLNLKLFPVLVRPNLGQPEFLTPKNFDFNQVFLLSQLPEFLEYEFDGLLTACNQSTINEIDDELNNRLYIYPISEKMKNGRGIRLRPVPLVVKEFKPVDILQMDDPNYRGHPQKYLNTEKVFPGRENYYKIKFSFKIPFSILYKLLPKKYNKSNTIHQNRDRLRKFVLCDIVYDLNDEEYFKIDSVDKNYSEYFSEDIGEIPKRIVRVNYHSIVLTIKDWTNMIFWHATDLHSSKRYDTLNQFVLNKMIKKKRMLRKDSIVGEENKKIITSYFKKIYRSQIDERLKSINKRIKDKRCFAYPISKEIAYSKKDFFWKLPVEYRIQNYNNNLRMLIYEANDAFKKNELDFIILGGDITDYAKSKKMQKYSYEFKFTNWKHFIDMILGKPHNVKNPNSALLEPEELIVPIFTIPGNHDYVGHQYPPFINNNFGLKNEEIKLYPGSFISTMKSLYANIKYLRGYFQFINPDLNFAKKLGRTHFLFLDSDKNSSLDIHDIFRKSPSTKGLRDFQLKWARNYCSQNVSKDENVIVITHSPPINPPKVSLIKNSLTKLFPEYKKELIKTGLDTLSINLLKEYSLIKKFNDPRIDPLINLKFGTIVRNWEEMFQFLLNCKDKGISKRVNLVLCGHAHKNMEFRIEPLMGRELEKIAYI